MAPSNTGLTLVGLLLVGCSANAADETAALFANLSAADTGTGHAHDRGDAARDVAPSDADALDAGVEDAAIGDAGEPAIPDPADEHCGAEMPRDPRDETLEGEPIVTRFAFSRDVLLPQAMIDWMDEHGLPPAHDAWHLTRRWDEQCGESFAPTAGCDFAEQLTSEHLWRAEHQQGAPGAGLAFLHMHRHMIQMFKSAFPANAPLFEGFSHVPRSRDDPENPTPWKRIRWNSDELVGFDILENIEEHLDQFASEDELGLFIESTFRWTADDPVVALDQPGAGVHNALHNQWAVSRSTANLGRTDTALPNHVFWRLHGFIDEVWSRYRSAKGLRDDDPGYLTVAHQECRLMYLLAPEHRPIAEGDRP